MDNCYQENICNCVKDCKCDDGYECCSEYVPENKRPKYGLCVHKGTCDTKRGICNSKNKPNSKVISELYSEDIKEGFSIFKPRTTLDWVAIIMTSLFLFCFVCLCLLFIFKREDFNYFS